MIANALAASLGGAFARAIANRANSRWVIRFGLSQPNTRADEFVDECASFSADCAHNPSYAREVLSAIWPGAAASLAASDADRRLC